MNASPGLIPSLSLTLLFYPVMWRVFYPFGRFKVFCRHSVDVLYKLFYMYMSFLDMFVGEGEHYVLLLHHLDPCYQELLNDGN